METENVKIVSPRSPNFTFRTSHPLRFMLVTVEESWDILLKYRDIHSTPFSHLLPYLL
jgi:hypothetical protein